MGRNLIEEALRRELVQTFEDPDYRPPPLPSVIVRLSQMALGDEAGIREVVYLLEQDPMLAGIVLRRASSALYAGRSPITTLHQAVVRLGLKTLHNVAFEVVLRRGVFDVPAYRETIERISRHGTVAAHVAKLVCESCGMDGEVAFLCGLLHDIGFSALLFSAANRAHDASGRLEGLWQDFDRMHERASNLVARLWSLSPQTCEVLGHHHHPDRCPTLEASRIAAAVCVADALTERFGADIKGPKNADGTSDVADRVGEANLAAARAQLGLDDRRLETLLEKAKVLVRDIAWI